MTPAQIIELKSLMGDTADNIPGIPGVGEKTATKMIVEFGTIENAYVHLEEIKPNKARESLREHYDLAELSKALATINTESPLEYVYEEARLGNLYTPEAYQLCKQLEFKNLLGRFDTSAVPENTIEPAVILEAQKHCLRKLLRKIISVWHCFLIKKAYMALE